MHYVVAYPTKAYLIPWVIVAPVPVDVVNIKRNRKGELRNSALLASVVVTFPYLLSAFLKLWRVAGVSNATPPVGVSYPKEL